MKNFVVNFGRILIDICAWVLLVAIVIAGLVTMTTNFWSGLAILFVGLISFVIIFYFLYLLIDIRDALVGR